MTAMQQARDPRRRRPRPRHQRVIGAATIRARLEGIDVIGIRDGFEWIMQGDIDHVDAAVDRHRQPDPLPRRLAPRHRARQPDQGSGAARQDDRLAAAARRLAARHDRRRRHRLLGDEARSARRRPHPRRPRAEDDRQRPRSAAARRHLRLPVGAPLRRRHRQEPDGRRQDDVALVLRDRDGPQGRPPRARHRQGRGRDDDAHHRGVHAADPAEDDRRLAGRRDPQAAWPTAAATASRSSPRASCSTSRRRTSRAWPSVERDAHGHLRLAEVNLGEHPQGAGHSSGCERSASRRRSPPRTSATSCAAPIRFRSTWSTRATSATAPRSSCSRAATRRWSRCRAATSSRCRSRR